MEEKNEYAKRLEKAFREQDSDKRKRQKKENFVINLTSKKPDPDNSSTIFFNSFVLAHEATFISAFVQPSTAQKDSMLVLSFNTEYVEVNVNIPVKLFADFTTAGVRVPSLPAGTVVSARYVCPFSLIKDKDSFSVNVALTFN